MYYIGDRFRRNQTFAAGLVDSFAVGYLRKAVSQHKGAALSGVFNDMASASRFS